MTSAGPMHACMAACFRPGALQGRAVAATLPMLQGGAPCILRQRCQGALQEGSMVAGIGIPPLATLCQRSHEYMGIPCGVGRGM